MATTQTEKILQHLWQVTLPQAGSTQPDGELLAAFIDHGDESAFASLVRRHGSMVLGACRRIVGNHQDAEDAFQVTFLVLARKASFVRPRDRVAGFLHGVARRTALKVRAQAAKRRARETQVLLPERPADALDPLHELQALLDQELVRLPEKYRFPILLCDLDGRSIKEAATHLGWPQGTLAGRLVRGRKMLAWRLARYGYSPSTVPLVAPPLAVPASLVSSTVKAAIHFAAGHAASAGLVTAEVAALMEGVMTSMTLSKLRWVVGAVLAAVCLCSVGVGIHVLARADSESPTSRKKPSTPGVSISKNAGQPNQAFPVAKANPVEAKTDLERLQGEWKLVSWDLGSGGASSGDELLHKKRLVVAGNRWKVLPNPLKDDDKGRITFTLNETKKPKEITLSAEDGSAPGIYRIEGDTLTVCVRVPWSRGARPTSFAASQFGLQVQVFKRISKQPVTDIRTDREKMQGTWRVVRLGMGGGPLVDAVMVASGGNMEDLRNETCVCKAERYPDLTLQGDVLQWGERKCKFELNPGATPKHLDWIDEDKKRIPGIYKFEGRQLFIHLDKPGSRPTEFRTAEGDVSSIVFVLELAPPVTPAPRSQKEMSDKEKLQGTWQLSSYQAREKKLRARLRNGIWKAPLTVRGDEMNHFLRDSGTAPDRPGPKPRFILNPADNPGHFDLILPADDANDKETRVQGIYKFEEDKLWLCIPEFPDKRPSEFSATRDDDREVFVFERAPVLQRPQPK